MERVVVWPAQDEPGWVNIHWKSPEHPGMMGRPYKTLDEFMNMAGWLATHPKVASDVYFCLSLQMATGKVFKNTATAHRHAKQALKLKAIWLDMDIKPEKGYANIGEALDALERFVAAAKIPLPSAIVMSGGGLHIYWISTVPLSVDEWEAYAYGLKAETVRFNLRCDGGLTTDCARVLRVPGTFNGKTTPSKPVRLAGLGQSIDFSVGLAALKEIGTRSLRTTSVTGPVTNTNAIDLSKFIGKQPALLLRTLPKDSLAEGINLKDDRPLNPEMLFKHCPHFFDAAKTHGKSYSQGLWMQDVLASTFFDDGRRWAHYFSKGFSKYTIAETDAMFDRKLKDREDHGLGWPSCQAFENEGCKHCATCPRKGTIRSPLNLAERFQPPAIKISYVPAVGNDLLLPDGYTVDPTTQEICEIVQKDLGNEVFEDQLVRLFMCRIKDPEMVGGEGTPRALQFWCSLDMSNWGRVSIPAEAIASETELLRLLHKQGCLPYVPHQRRIPHFLTSWQAKVDKIKLRLKTVPFGWITENGKQVGFAYGGQVMNSDGSVTSAGVADPVLANVFTPRGSIDPWFEALKVITDQKYPPLEVIVGLSFAAPLMHVPSQYNAVLNAWSEEGGSHKSTSIAVGIAVWADPQLNKENALSTPKGLLRRLGQLRNLPVYLDEINRSEQMKTVQKFLDLATEGSGPTTLRTDRSFGDVDSWQSLIGVGANVSLWDQILRSNRNSDAQLERVFEIKIERRPDTRDPLEVSRLIGSLKHNYGQMGLIYSQMISRNPAWVDTFVRQLCKDFNDDVKVESRERFRAAICGTIIGGMTIANRLGATFNLTLVYDYLKQQFLEQRSRIMSSTTVGSTMMNISDRISEFLNETSQNVLWTDTMHVGRGKPPVVTILSMPNRIEPIFVRCSVDDRRILVSRARFDQFMLDHDHSPSTTIAGLEKHYHAVTNGPRMNLTSGTKMIGSRGPVIDIPVPTGSDLEELLYKHTPVPQRSTSGMAAALLAGLGQTGPRVATP